MDAQQQMLAEQALEQSGLQVDKLSPEQRQQILEGIAERIGQTNTDAVGLGFYPSWKCLACEVGLNIVGGAAIAAMIVAGAVVGPETVGVAAIAEFFGVGATAVASVINGALGAGGAATIESIIAALCEAFGACPSSD